jgi:predicted aspartyl protease
MPIDECPFTSIDNVAFRPYLPINIINPHTGNNLKTIGLIDTGADECAIPASIASLLGHNLQNGKIKTIGTGNGLTIAYTHTTKFEIYHPISFELLYTVSDTPIDFMPNLHMVLLGVKSFLSRFILEINYPKKTFSINTP